MISALIDKVKTLLGLETDGRKRRLPLELGGSPPLKIRRSEKPFGPTNYDMNPRKLEASSRVDSRTHRSLLQERPDVEVCWEKTKPGKENQFNWVMLAKDSEDNEVPEVDEDVQVWRELKPRRRTFLDSRSSAEKEIQKSQFLSKDEMHLEDDRQNEVIFLKESSRREENFPRPIHSSIRSGRSNHKYSTNSDTVVGDSAMNSSHRISPIFTNSSSIASLKSSDDIYKFASNQIFEVNVKKDTKGLNRLDSPSIKNRIRNGNLSRAAILKQTLPPPPLFFGTEPKLAAKWLPVKKKPSALDMSSSIDEMKAYNQMLQQFTSDKNSVSKMLSSGLELPAFKMFESQLKRNTTFNKLLNNNRVPIIKSTHKIDTIDLSKVDDDDKECDSLRTEPRISLIKRLSVPKDTAEITGTRQKVVKVDVKHSREVTPKVSGESEKNASVLVRKTPNVVDEMITKSHFTNEEYLEDLMNRYSLEKKNRNKELERERMRKKLWTEKREKMEGTLEDRLKKYMKITEVVLDDIQVIEEEERLPELTSEMLEVVYSALRKNRSCVLSHFGSNTITGADIQTLADSNWLNDEVINNYMDMLIQRGQSKEYPSVYAFNTFFYPKLSSSGYASVKRWTKKVDLFQQDMVLVPLHLEVHWALAVIDFRQKTICYYDSMNGRKINILQLMLKYLHEEKLDKKKENFDSSGWQTKLVQDIPQQRNGYDCGVFACMFAEHLARGVAKDGPKKNGLKCNRSYPPFPFSQENMAYFRKRMIYEILTGKILE